MKKILWISAIVSCLTSCVIEYHEPPLKTLVGYRIARETTMDMRTTACLVDIVKAAEMWRNATTEHEKYEIEDNYFGENIKVRKYTDTISIGNLFKINTFGKPFSETHWEVLSNLNNYGQTSMYEVSSISANSYKINPVSSSSESAEELTVEVITPHKEYSVSGKAYYAQRLHDYALYKILYEIKSEVKFKLQGMQLVMLNWEHNSNPEEGQVKIEVFKEGTLIERDNTSVTYLPNKMEISYRGFTDPYWNY